MRETALAAGGGHAASQAAVYGALSLIFWALVIVVTIKYVGFIMRADNNGEGGVMALAALAHRAPVLARRQDRHRRRRADGPGAVLWRRHADAGHLGAVGAWKAWAPARRLQALDRAADPGHPGRAVPAAEPRHRKDRQAVRAGDGAVVHRAGGAGRRRDRAGAADPVRRQSRAMAWRCSSTSPGPPLSRWARWCWRSPAARRFMPTWAISAPAPIRWAWLYFAFPALVLNYFGQGALLLSDPERGAACCSMPWCRAGCIIPWWCWRPSPPSSPRRR